MDASFADISCYLIKDHNFYARILSGLQVEESTQVPMMGIRIVNRHFCVTYNPVWLRKTTFLDVVATIHHEILHAILAHIPRGIDLYSLCTTAADKQLFASVAPIASDMAANCFLVDVDNYMATHLDEWVMPEDPVYELPRNETFEWYYYHLKKKCEEDPEYAKTLSNICQQNGQLQNHAAWQKILKELSVEELQGLQQELSFQTKTIVAKAVADHHKSRGTVPAFLQEYIDALLKVPIVPWLTLLRNKVIHTKRFKRRRGIARPNRRFFGIPQLIPFPGKTKDRTFTVAFLIDTSGSMGTPELEMAYSELLHLQKADDDILIHIIEADAAVAREYVAGPDTEIKPDFQGRGGTTFDPALIRAKEIKPDIVFYYTDGYGPAPEVHNRVDCPFVWLLTGSGAVPDKDWGSVLRMEDK